MKYLLVLATVRRIALAVAAAASAALAASGDVVSAVGVASGALASVSALRKRGD